MLQSNGTLKAWIDAGLAVSAEDDPPDRPVNVPVTEYRQHRMALTIRGIPCNLRYAMGGGSGSRGVVVLLHGHSSRLEEVEGLMQELEPLGYMPVAFDLPGCGYSSPLEQSHVARVYARSSAPILEFFEEVVDAFVQRVCKEQNLGGRVVLLGGGSLGGNLTLRMAERTPPPNWLQRIAPWSAGSVWPARTGPVEGGAGLGLTLDPRMNEEERSSLGADDSRRKYFRESMDDVFPGNDVPQSGMWYWDREGSGQWSGRSWSATLIAAARRERQELYSAEFRRLHWRVARDQMAFSHAPRDSFALVQGLHRPVFDPVATDAPCRRIDVPTLLIAGWEDNFNRVWIREYTRMMAESMRCPGACLILRDTGHSIHSERPNHLARLLDNHVQRT